MSKSTPTDEHGTSTRPYLIRGLHEWCTDNGFTPYVAVYVTAAVQVPMEYVKNNEIVLNIGFEATSGLKLDNEFIEFRARFGGVTREIVVPVDHVVAIYARENGQGMAFPAPVLEQGEPTPSVPTDMARAGGLRLASASDDADMAADGPAALLADAHDLTIDGQDPEPPPPEPPTPPSRPVLKRVK